MYLFFVELRMILNLGAFWKMFETLPSQQCIATEMLNGQLIIYNFFKKLFGFTYNFSFFRSATYGSFYSSKACEVLKPKDYPPRKRES